MFYHSGNLKTTGNFEAHRPICPAQNVFNYKRRSNRICALFSVVDLMHGPGKNPFPRPLPGLFAFFPQPPFGIYFNVSLIQCPSGSLMRCGSFEGFPCAANVIKLWPKWDNPHRSFRYGYLGHIWDYVIWF